MAKRVKSQLELYMEELEMDRAEEAVPRKATSSFFTSWWSTSEGRDWLYAQAEFAVSLTLTGVVQDSVIAIESFSRGCTSVSSSVKEAAADTLLTGLRRWLQFTIVGYAVTKAVNGMNPTSLFAIEYVLFKAMFLAFYCLVLFPVFVGVVTSYMDALVARKFRIAQNSTERILGVIKRVQLVHMGSSISHPMPPVAKLEESFLRSHSEHSGDIFSCGEMRVSLRDALLRLQSFFCENSAPGVHEATTVFRLEGLSSAVFASQREWRARPVSTLLSELATLRQDCWKRAGVSIMDENEHFEEDVVIEGKSFYRDELLLRAVRCLGVLLTLPLQLCHALHELNLYISRCQDMSEGLGAVDLQLSDGTQSLANSAHSYSDTYLAARQKLHKLRAAYEDINVRLWLADRQLADAAALQFLLPDSALLSTQYSSTLRVDKIDAALDRLSGNTRPTKSHSTGDCKVVLEGVEVLLDGLPTLRDFEVLYEDLLLLRTATSSSSTPASCKAEASMAIDAFTALPAVTSDTASTNDVNSGFIVPRDRTNQSLYEENPGLVESPARSTTSNLLDPTKTSNILDVFTTVIPRRAVVSKKAVVSAADQAAIARERAQARLLFRELNQHLRRQHTPFGADTGNHTEGDARLSVPLVGQYALERVRHISTKSAMSATDTATMLAVETEETDGDLQIETNLAQVDPSAFGLRDLSDSDEDENTLNTSRDAQREVKAFRVGTMLLTEEELRASSLSQPSALPASDVRSFQEEMRQTLRSLQPTTSVDDVRFSGGLPAPVSAFAVAVRSSHLQEATFGDDLSD